MHQIKSLLLELFRDSFQLDVALYREFHPEDRTLRCRLPSNKTGSLPEDCDIPPSVAVKDYPSYAMFDSTQVDDEGGVLPGAKIEPFCLNRANEQIREMLRVRIDLTESQQRYLNWIQSEIGIPIQIGDKIRGVIVGLAHRPNAFPPEREIVLRRFRYIAALWFQLSELHGAKARAIERLGTCIKAWSLLQDVEDTKLFAGLAAILTAGCGLGWHRALIFRNGKYASSTAELVYAVGGLGEPTHGEIQSATEERERDLEAFVRKRIDDPEPHGIDANSKEDRYDSLYLKYIKQAKRPVTVSYSDRESEQLRPILKASGMSPPDFLCLTQDAPLIQSMNRTYPGLFPARKTYIFALHSNDPEQPGPLGFIAVDSKYCPKPLEQTDLALTKAIVELVRDTVLARLKNRFFDGIAEALPLMVHRPRINGCLSAFRADLGDLMQALRTSPGDVAAISKAAEDVEKSLTELEYPIREMVLPSSSLKSCEIPGGRLPR